MRHKASCRAPTGGPGYPRQEDRGTPDRRTPDRRTEGPRQEDRGPPTGGLGTPDRRRRCSSVIKAKYANDTTLNAAMECWFHTTGMRIDDVSRRLKNVKRGTFAVRSETYQHFSV
ncbi:hypothetical protein VZT92_015223 [Zoarces viviparus]|uniref:Uncharacterized protein n=1 Tax=Zoarces viviparus TaxID=48416 RepID=A0AAW1EW30_ZOAVI